VVSGGPCCGKTTIVDGLSLRGYYVLPEAARIIIEGELEACGELLPWIDYARFQNGVYQLQKLYEDRATKNKPVILDRSLWDIAAYSVAGRVNPPEGLLRDLEKNENYRAAFMLDPIPDYKNDHARRENRKQAEDLQKVILETYIDSGLEVVNVPVLEGPKERVGLVEKYISKFLEGSKS